jgi:hypothetical protein
LHTKELMAELNPLLRDGANITASSHYATTAITYQRDQFGPLFRRGIWSILGAGWNGAQIGEWRSLGVPLLGGRGTQARGSSLGLGFAVSFALRPSEVLSIRTECSIGILFTNTCTL